MPTKYIENTTANNLFVGGKMIPPGEGRDIDTSLLPPEHRDAAPADEAGGQGRAVPAIFLRTSITGTHPGTS